MLIARDIERRFLAALKQFPVVGIIGPRQVGKTTLAKSVIARHKKKNVYLDLEYPPDALLLREPEIFFQEHINECVVLDEVQRFPNLFPILRAVVDRKRKPGRFVLLGSASPELIRDSSESLAGRITYIELPPFSLSEIEQKRSLRQHWLRGGFPPAILAKDDRHAFAWLEAFIKTYVERDLPILGLNVSPSTILTFWTMLAHYHGGIWNAEKFAQALGISQPTVRHYLDFLDNAFIVHRLYPYAANVKKRLVKAPKIYIRDSGLLHRLVDITSFNELRRKVLIGASFEGYVIEQIKQRVPSNISLYYYRTHDGSECDLVLTSAGKPIATVEVKYSATPNLTKSHTFALQDIGTKQNFVISVGHEDFPLKNNVRACTLPVFLEKYLPQIHKNKRW